MAAVHTVPQAPQLSGLSEVRVSHPSLTSPLQSEKPALQDWMVHCPLSHSPVAFAGAQAVPQAPQWVSEVLVFASQPVL